MEPTPGAAMTLPAEVREKLAELELELSEGKLGSIAVASVQQVKQARRSHSCSILSYLVSHYNVRNGPCDISFQRGWFSNCYSEHIFLNNYFQL